MKKLLVLAAVAAMALGAKAEYSVYSSYFSHAKGDESPATANLQYYQAYIIQYAGAGAAALAYVQKQGLAGIQTVAKAQYDSTSDKNDWEGDIEQYYLNKSTASSSTLDIRPSEAYAVFYYLQGDAVSEFMVLGNSASSAFQFDDSFSGIYNSGWQTYTAPTPEPTSGLLLLLGMAGLALKRKVK